MVTVNGRPDTEETAHAIVIRILNESIVKHYGTRPGNDEVKEYISICEKGAGRNCRICCREGKKTLRQQS